MDWRFGLCVFSERSSDGFVNLQPDWFGEDENDDGGGEALESIHPYGFRSRPRDPETAPDGKGRLGAGLLYVFDGDEGFALPTQDPRHAALLEDEGKGGAQVYSVNNAGAVSRVFLAGSTGDITIQRASGPQMAFGASTIDATKVSDTAQNVALYSPIQPTLQEIIDTLQLLIAGDPAAIPTPVPGLGTIIAALPGGPLLTAALTTQLALLQAAALTALDSSLASSSVLRASTT